MTLSFIERSVGLQVFFTASNGLNGKLRTIPEDFIVEEIFCYPPKEKEGKFVIAEVTSKNWETNLLVREMAHQLHISRKSIGFAGTKDKRAVTTQLMSFYTSFRKVSKLHIRDSDIKNLYTSNKRIAIGDLLGNRFTTVVRDIDLDKDIILDRLHSIKTNLFHQGGFPNFYGIQRFGIMRPITHIVGKYLVKGDFEKAVMSYIANPIRGEHEDVYKARQYLQETYDFAEALKQYPDSLHYEKAILNELIKNPDDFVNSLKSLPKNLLTLFVHAYQSYLFNQMLSERIKRKLPLNKAEIGDIIFPIRSNKIDEIGLLVTASNIDKVNKQITKGKAFVSGLLLGSDSTFSKGAMGEIENDLIEQERLDPRDFIIPEISFLSSSGSRRPLLASLKKIDWKIATDEINKAKFALILKFELQKGCYGTSLLREFMKVSDIKKY